RLVTFFGHIGKMVEQHVQLGARLAVLLGIDQARVAGGLAQPEQRFQDLDLGLADPFTLDAVQECLAIMSAEVVIALALGRFQFAKYRLFNLGRQIWSTFFLGSPEEERPERLAQKLSPLLVGALGTAAPRLKDGGGS